MSTDKKEYGISVIIPCYNVGQYVEETLKSVLNQSFKNYEIICLDAWFSRWNFRNIK